MTVGSWRTGRADDAIGASRISSGWCVSSRSSVTMAVHRAGGASLAASSRGLSTESHMPVMFVLV